MKSSYVIAGVITVAAVGWMASGQFPAGGATGDAAAPVEPGQVTAQQAAPAPAAEADKPFPVRVRSVVAQEHLRELVLYGRTEADRTVQVRVETDGQVAERPVTKGQKVKAGQVLAQLNMDDRAARLQQAEAEVRSRQVAYDAATDLAKKNFRSKVQLVEEEAALAAAKAALRTIRVAIDHTRVRAPFDGVVEDLPVEDGDYLKTGDPVARIMDLDPLVVAAEVSERDINRVHVGGWAQVTLVDGRQAEGTVRYVAKASDNSTRTFRVEIAIDNPDGVWLGGLPDRLDMIIVGQEFVREGQTVQAVPETAPPQTNGKGAHMAVSDS
ncbi:MAG: efflux RND transporter periplasmic adaptor subunit [Rhodobacterales bacterium]|nr:efflux RND transporter periplasmic adaptor subunit [Rhodobacterales bacterium]